MLRRVGERLAGDEVGRGLEVVVEALIGRLDHRSQRRARGELPQCCAQAVVEPRRSDTPGQFAKFFDRLAELGDGGVELACFPAWRRQLALDVAKRKPDRNQTLLGSV